ncbi:MAG: phenylalanine--tRNA ligase subunit beta [Erysipelotrichaceae bacterium]|nr:phenylalanine--tRNA ligase subunit beta [Erysipelotrichaceae bacterium]
MRLSYKWLGEYVDLSGITPEELAEKMTTAGLEVEGIEPLASATNLVIGEVLECEDIPDTHLHSTRTRVGVNPEDINEIVCGAPNCRRGLKVIVALPGAKLPGGTITPKPVRGYTSNGMLCSLNELGVDKKYLRQEQLDGIEELPADAPVGETDVLGYLGLDDTILDVSLTPNRADCSAMWNMAKEVGAILHREVKWPDYEGKADVGEETSFRVSSETENCPVFYGKVVNHVKVGPSPKWMTDYLHAAGINSINNVVDISNFVMLETGQPLHFYDLSKLPAHEITVVDDRELKMTALDGVEFEIQKGDLLITTGGEATGIAGVMGGEESMIDENTTSIFIEAASFNHASIRRTSIRLNLITEAAQRFTKGLEPLSMAKAVDRSVQLLSEYADASGFEKTVIAGDNSYEPRIVKETLTHCNELLGTSFTMDQVKEVLEWLDFRPEVNGDEITCHIPSYRTDIERPADIDEEIIRLIGFDSLEGTLPFMSATVGRLSPAQSVRRTLREILRSYGLHEIVTYTLVSQDYIDNAYQPAGTPVALAMPMSEARKYIRTSLINSVLECVQYNEAHQSGDACLFEISKVYGEGVEQERLAIVLDGNVMEDRLHNIHVPGDFYAMKSIAETLLAKLGFAAGRVRIMENRTDTEHFHPYRSAELWLDKYRLGVFGEVHPAYAEKFDLKRVVYAELTIDPLFETKPGKLRFEAIDRYPSVSRDIALVVASDITAGQILEVIKKSGRKLVRSTEVFDVYEGEHVAEGYKSVALRIVYQAADHTLKDEEITEIHNFILENLRKKVKAELRA